MDDSQITRSEVREWLQSRVTQWALRDLERRFPAEWNRRESSMEALALKISRQQGQQEVKEYLNNLPSQFSDEG